VRAPGFVASTTELEPTSGHAAGSTFLVIDLGLCRPRTGRGGTGDFGGLAGGAARSGLRAVQHPQPLRLPARATGAHAAVIGAGTNFRKLPPVNVARPARRSIH
jgi:hypothetical protein